MGLHVPIRPYLYIELGPSFWGGLDHSRLQSFVRPPPWRTSPDLNLTPLAAFLRFLPSAARVRSDLSQFSWGRSEPKVVRWQIKDQSCFSYPEMMFQINLCYFLCWLVSLLLSWVQWNYSIGGKCCANVRLLQNTFTLSPMMHLSSQW